MKTGNDGVQSVDEVAPLLAAGGALLRSAATGAALQGGMSAAQAVADKLKKKKETPVAESTAADTLRPNSMPANIPDTKAGMLAQIMAVAGGMSKDDLNKFAEMMAQIGKEADPIPDGAAAQNAGTIKAGAMKEDIDEMFGDTLSEEVKEKAATLFEAAVGAKLAVEAAKIEEAAAQALIEQTGEIVEAITAKVDQYLDYVVEKWMEENEVAIDTTLRAEVMESFVDGLKNLFTEHYIDIPDDKIDVVEELGNKVEELEAQLNASIAETVELRNVVAEGQAKQVFADMSEGLAATQVEKFRQLAESITFDGDVEAYSGKLAVIKESFFGSGDRKPAGSTQLVLEESLGTDPDHVDSAPVTGPMAVYAQAISRTVKK